MLPLRLVIDTNVLISAALKPGGLQRTTFLLATTKPARLYVTRPILEEYADVLSRPELRIRKGLRLQLLQLSPRVVHVRIVETKPACRLSISVPTHPDLHHGLLGAGSECEVAETPFSGTTTLSLDRWSARLSPSSRPLVRDNRCADTDWLTNFNCHSYSHLNLKERRRGCMRVADPKLAKSRVAAVQKRKRWTGFEVTLSGPSAERLRPRASS
jgi:PIN domain-containing protein